MTKPPLRAEVLARLIREHRWTAGAELGVLHGHTTRHLLKACPALRLTAVDTWKHGDPGMEPPEDGRRTEADSGFRSYADVDMEAAYEGVLALAAEHPRRLAVMRMTTARAAELVPSASLCWVFHDASHQADDLEHDIRAWMHTLKPGAWVLGHDWDHHSVASVIDRLLPWHDRMAGNVWAIPVEDVRL